MQPKTQPFTFFTNIQDIPILDWERVVAGKDLFLSLDYLKALSQALSNKLSYIYVMVYAGDVPIVAGVFQIATFTYKKGAHANVLLKLFQEDKNRDESLSIKGLVCGNIFATGAHGFAHTKAVSFTSAAELVASAAKQICTLEGYTNAFSGQLIKDFDTQSAQKLEVLEDFKYRPFQVDVTMVLALHKTWLSFPQYLESMKAKYRTKAKSALKKAEALRLVSLSVSEISRYQNHLQVLFNNVQRQSEYSYGETYPQAFKALKEHLGPAFICKAAFLNETIIGFSTAFINGTTLEASYVGLDYDYNTKFAVYERLLYDYVEEAILQNATLLHLGRTSELIKSALGATPQPMILYARHTSKFKNALLKPILENISPSVFDLRMPFKAAFYEQTYK